jgi:transglutaminase-like putative cysteine protease
MKYDHMMQSRLVRLGIVTMFTMMCSAGGSEPRTRSFSLEYKAIVKDIPAGAKRLDLWVPVPHNDPYQRITNIRVQAPSPYTISTGSEGNAILHTSIDSPKETTVAVDITFNTTREEHRQSRLYSGPRLARDQDPKELRRWLNPDRLVPIDDKIRTWAREVVEAAHAHTDLEMARAIYNHVVSTMKYDKTGRGWGRGDIYFACDARRGNCTDFHAVFIGYCRALGIPARFAIGFPLPAERGEGRIAGYHCWAEFYAKGIGWVPIDASEAAKDPARREYFFGAHDENRIELTKGRDVVLAPKQKGDPLNFFVYPYAEVDGKPFSGTEFVATYRDALSSQATGQSSAR